MKFSLTFSEVKDCINGMIKPTPAVSRAIVTKDNIKNKYIENFFFRQNSL